METVNISIQLLNGILGYLGTRPYTEVFQLIEQLQNDKETSGKFFDFGRQKTTSNNLS